MITGTYLVVLLYILCMFVNVQYTDSYTTTTYVLTKRSRLSWLASSSSSESMINDSLNKKNTGTSSSKQKSKNAISMKNVDNRPHEQRVKQQRKARRLNHSFMHLYRHDNPTFDDQKIAPSSKSMNCAKTYLMEYGSFGTYHSVTEDQIDSMSRQFPPLLELDVKRHLRPKLRFLKYTLGCVYDDEDNDDEDDDDDDMYKKSLLQDITSIPPQYFGARLEKVIAPKHAFLVHMGLPHGKILLQNNATLFQDFLISCRRSKSFCALCNQWMKEYGITNKYVDEYYKQISREYNGENDNEAKNHDNSMITPKDVDAFDALFSRCATYISLFFYDTANEIKSYQCYYSKEV